MERVGYLLETNLDLIDLGPLVKTSLGLNQRRQRGPQGLCSDLLDLPQVISEGCNNNIGCNKYRLKEGIGQLRILNFSYQAD